MKEKPIWTRIAFIVGTIVFIVGTIDPLEGSVLILAGSFLFALSAYFTGDRYFKLFLTYFVMMVVGVFFLFYLSSFGGFGEGALSWWWSILVLPYPLAWLLTVITLIIRNRKKPQKEIISQH
jgi:hypothetical protein